MLTFWGLVTAVTVFGGLPIVGGLWLFQVRRSRGRNLRGECAGCGRPWQSMAGGEPYLIHGRLVCEDCAVTARRRMPWHFAIIGLAAAAAATGVALAEGGLALIILLPIAATTVMTAGALQLMKLANRAAQRRIAAGDYPGAGALRP